MMSKNNNINIMCVLGAVFVLASCLPKEGERIYPYNYNGEDEYYLTEDESEFLPESSGENENGVLLAPAGGMVFTPLFSAPTSSEKERFSRLESAVQVLRNDVDVLIPRMFQVAEKQFAEEKKAAADAAKVAPEKPIDLKSGTEAVKTTDIATNDIKLASVFKVRIADHSDLTRVVLDLNSSLQLKTLISADGKKLTVDAANLKWLPVSVWNALSGKLVSGYKYENGGLQVELMYPSKISRQSLLRPNKDSKYYRMVIDLVSDRVHKN